nr:unnamed protein product [Mus musculus]
MNSDRTQTRTRASCRQSCCRRSNEHACTLERPEEDEGKYGQLESMTVFSLGSRPPHKSHLLVAENSTDCLESVAASQSCNTRTPRQRWMSASAKWLGLHSVKKSSMNSDRPQTRTRASCRSSCCRRSNEHACTLERPEEDEGKYGQLESMTVFSLGSRPPHKSHLLVDENSTGSHLTVNNNNNNNNNNNKDCGCCC